MRLRGRRGVCESDVGLCGRRDVCESDVGLCSRRDREGRVPIDKRRVKDVKDL